MQVNLNTLEVRVADFEIAVKKVLKLEGVSFEDMETGEITKYGISLKLIKGLADAGRETYGIEPTVEGIRGLTKPQAKKVYRGVFWDEMKLDGVKEQEVADKIMDAGVNMGPQIPVRIAQRVAGVDVDGIVGPKTLKAINKMKGKEFLVQYRQGLEDRYRGLAANRLVLKKYLDGWIARTRS